MVLRPLFATRASVIAINARDAGPSNHRLSATSQPKRARCGGTRRAIPASNPRNTAGKVLKAALLETLGEGAADAR